MRFSATILAFFLIATITGCDTLATDEVESKPQAELGTRSLGQIKDSEGITVRPPGPPILLEGDSVSTEEFRLSGVLQTGDDLRTTRYLLEFRALGSEITPRFLMEVREAERNTVASSRGFVQWSETKSGLTQPLENFSASVRVDSLTTVSVRRVYPDGALGVATNYDYDH